MQPSSADAHIPRNVWVCLKVQLYSKTYVYIYCYLFSGFTAKPLLLQYSMANHVNNYLEESKLVANIDK